MITGWRRNTSGALPDKAAFMQLDDKRGSGRENEVTVP